MNLLTILLLYLLINLVITIVFWAFIPGKMESNTRYFALMTLFGLPVSFAYVGIGAFVMIIKLAHNEKTKKQD